MPNFATTSLVFKAIRHTFDIVEDWIFPLSSHQEAHALQIVRAHQLLPQLATLLVEKPWRTCSIYEKVEGERRAVADLMKKDREASMFAAQFLTGNYSYKKEMCIPLCSHHGPIRMCHIMCSPRKDLMCLRGARRAIRYKTDPFVKQYPCEQDYIDAMDRFKKSLDKIDSAIHNMFRDDTPHIVYESIVLNTPFTGKYPSQDCNYKILWEWYKLSN